MKLTRTLNEFESKDFIRSYGIPAARDTVCPNKEALKAVVDIPFPWVMKIVSADILHKTEAGGVKLGIADLAEAEEVFDVILQNAKAYKPDAVIDGVLVQEMVKTEDIELIFGITQDPQFGHVLLFGLGGVYVELFKVASLRLVPLSEYDARKMIDELPLAKLFDGFRGKQYDKDEVIQIIMNLSRMVQEHPEIKEVDINPLLLKENGQSKAVDAVIVV